jgi:hypothetical protein
VASPSTPPRTTTATSNGRITGLVAEIMRCVATEQRIEGAEPGDSHAASGCLHSILFKDIMQEALARRRLLEEMIALQEITSDDEALACLCIIAYRFDVFVGSDRVSSPDDLRKIESPTEAEELRRDEDRRERATITRLIHALLRWHVRRGANPQLADAYLSRSWKHDGPAALDAVDAEVAACAQAQASE